MFDISAIVGTDSYKVGHWKQYPNKTEYIHSYEEARVGAHWLTTVAFMNLQYFLKKYLRPVTFDDVVEARDVFKLHFGNDRTFNEAGWARILVVHKGRLPVRIRAVPEGTVVPISNVLMTIENEDPQLPWLTNYLETRFSHVWYPITIATQTHYAAQTIRKWLEKTGDPALLSFKLHDFGYRGVSSEETAAIGGLAHLTSAFRGSDNLAAIMMGRQHYGCPMAGFSINAAEHSTITSWGRDHEEDAYRNMLQRYPDEMFAAVSDSYDLRAACEHLWGGALREEVLARKAAVVIRPDSGKPTQIVPEVHDILGEKFGFVENHKGYRILHPNVRVIQGDGIKPVNQSIDDICAALAARGWSTDNVGFGSGGGLLQDVNRDTQRMAFKCSAARVDGVWRDVYKAPKTDFTKSSKGGRNSLYRTEDAHYYTAEEGGSPSGVDVMQTVYERGEILLHDTLDNVRKREEARRLAL